MALDRCSIVTSAGADAEHPRRRLGVDVAPGGERGDQARVLREVGDAAQLDLVVVGHQQLAARRRHERPPERAPQLGADGDVVQVGLVGRQPAGAGHRLVEGGVDAAVVGHLGQQPVAVGRPQLLDLAVGQQVLDDRVLALQAFERGGVGRVAGLGLLLRGEAQLVEEDLAHLRRRVDVELGARVLVDLRPVRLDLGVEVVAQAAQLVGVDADADRLHAGQHADERDLDRVVEVRQVAVVRGPATGAR